MKLDVPTPNGQLNLKPSSCVSDETESRQYMTKTVIEMLGLLTFGGLTIYYTCRRELRSFVSGTTVLACACVRAR